MEPVTMQAEQVKPLACFRDEHPGCAPLLTGEDSLISSQEYAAPPAPHPWETPSAVGLALKLLTMLRSRPPRRNRPPRPQWNLPNGYVLAVRYSSR